MKITSDGTIRAVWARSRVTVPPHMFTYDVKPRSRTEDTAGLDFHGQKNGAGLIRGDVFREEIIIQTLDSQSHSTGRYGLILELQAQTASGHQTKRKQLLIVRWRASLCPTHFNTAATNRDIL